MIKKKITYRPYPLKKLMIVNKQKFNTIIISSHYEEKHSYMNDEKILVIVKQLDKKDDFIPKFQGKLPNGIEWQSFFWEPFIHENKTYRLVWYWEMDKPYLWILHCFRRKKYEKKN